MEAALFLLMVFSLAHGASTLETVSSGPTGTKTWTSGPTDNICQIRDMALTYEKVGCFKDKVDPSERVLKKIAFEDRDKDQSQQTWKEWKTYLPELVCRCAEAANNMGQVDFGVQFFEECWTSIKKNDDYTKLGGISGTVGCDDTEFEDCEDTSSKACAGTANLNYVYKVLRVWNKVLPQTSWCTEVGRTLIARQISYAECQKRCEAKPGCKVIEYWEKPGNEVCNQCLDTSMVTAYTNATTPNYPVYVWAKGKNKDIYKYLITLISLKWIAPIPKGMLR
ncbi:hypothetical protein OS493_029884 [Desmophyllum pertusum]|uniref:Apple domain-containing protein n=1 Tax=Desmophyllum pertusum TaxID=174260 RepID=A0A9W9Y8U1_9CNID|nr:hypothetical protein OS493_029884 [Desmophyllum pertusum]